MNTKLSAPTVLMRESDEGGVTMPLWEGVFATGVGGKRGCKKSQGAI